MFCTDVDSIVLCRPANAYLFFDAFESLKTRRGFPFGMHYPIVIPIYPWQGEDVLKWDIVRAEKPLTPNFVPRPSNLAPQTFPHVHPTRPTPRI